MMSLVTAKLYLSQEFLHHVHEFDALQVSLAEAKGFKLHHLLSDPFDKSMILLYQIVLFLDLAYLDLSIYYISRRACKMKLTAHSFRNAR